MAEELSKDQQVKLQEIIDSSEKLTEDHWSTIEEILDSIKTEITHDIDSSLFGDAKQFPTKIKRMTEAIAGFVEEFKENVISLPGKISAGLGVIKSQLEASTIPSQKSNLAKELTNSLVSNTIEDKDSFIKKLNESLMKIEQLIDSTITIKTSNITSEKLLKKLDPSFNRILTLVKEETGIGEETDLG